MYLHSSGNLRLLQNERFLLRERFCWLDEARLFVRDFQASYLRQVTKKMLQHWFETVFRIEILY